MAFNQSSAYPMSKLPLIPNPKIKDYLRCTRLTPELYNAHSVSLGEKYEIEGKEKKAVIFSHVKYRNQRCSTREGGVTDAESLQTALEKRKFKVTLRQDYTHRQIQKELIELSEKNHTNTGCLLIVAMTHGDADKLQAFDKPYSTDTLWSYFVGDCPTLNDKPKVVLIQACRGSKQDSGVLVRTLKNKIGAESLESQKRTLVSSVQDTKPTKQLRTEKPTNSLAIEQLEILKPTNVASTVLSMEPKEIFVPESDGFYTEDQTAKDITVSDAAPTPKESPKKLAGNNFKAIIESAPDLLLMCSTTNGYVSWRNHTDGSYFIQSLCNELNENGHEKHLLQLLTDVSCRVAHLGIGDSRCKQMTCIESTLTKQLFLTP